MAHNSKDVAPITFASFFMGCSLNAQSPDFDQIEMIHMLKITQPCLIFCDVDRYDFVVDGLNKVGLKIDIFTFDGHKGESKSVENLFVETSDEVEFL